MVISNMFDFPFHIWDVILPIDELILFKMVIAPPTRYPQYLNTVLLQISEVSQCIQMGPKSKQLKILKCRQSICGTKRVSNFCLG